MIVTIAEETDRNIQQDVLDELDWDPEVEVTDVGVEVDDRVVTLTGTVDSYAKKWASEKAALRVVGVRAVADEIDVKLPGSIAKTDTDIAKAVANSLEANTSVPFEMVDIKVEDGRVRLGGEANWNYERVEAENAARRVGGVKSVINLITIKPRPASAEEIRTNIERALVRSAEVDADTIRVRIEDRHAILSGTVRAWAEKKEAEDAAWRALGITKVTNNIRVQAM